MGDQPAALVRNLSAKITQMLTARLSNVAPEGEFAVKARSRHESKLELGPGASISWEFRLQSKDIGFAATFVTTAPDGTESTVEVAPYAKIYAEHGALRGAYAPSGSFAKGTIVFSVSFPVSPASCVCCAVSLVRVMQWDNSFSKMTSKTVAFKLQYAN
jgi:hypothetical protein